MGNRDDIDQMSGGNGVVLTTALKLIDKYDLYGQVAYPKHHKQSDVPEIYRLAAKTKVFVQCLLSYDIRNMLYILSLDNTVQNGINIFFFFFSIPQIQQTVVTESI
jgi:hypothetical protein